MWDCLPDLVIEWLFEYLGFKEMLKCGRVCSTWQLDFGADRLWRNVYAANFNLHVAPVRGGVCTPWRASFLTRMAGRVLEAAATANAAVTANAVANEVARLQDELACVVCLESRSTVVLLPCMHLCLCENCAIASTYCVMCRTVVSSRHTVLFAQY